MKIILLLIYCAARLFCCTERQSNIFQCTQRQQYTCCVNMFPSVSYNVALNASYPDVLQLKYSYFYVKHIFCISDIHVEHFSDISLFIFFLLEKKYIKKVNSTEYQKRVLRLVRTSALTTMEAPLLQCSRNSLSTKSRVQSR